MRLFLVIVGVTVLVISSITTRAQFKITTVKGDVFLTTEYKTTTENDFKEVVFLNHKGRKKYLEYESIFSIKSSEKYSVIYEPQNELDYSVQDMQSLVNGRIDGRKTNKLWIPFSISYVATTCTGFFDKGDFFIAPLVPLGTTISIGLFGWATKKDWPDRDDYYDNGYNERRTFRMIKASLIGSGAGLLTGAVIHSIRNF